MIVANVTRSSVLMLHSPGVAKQSRGAISPVGNEGNQGPIVELTRLQLKSMAFDDENVAKCFGLEIARIVLDGVIGILRLRDTKRKRSLSNNDAHGGR